MNQNEIIKLLIQVYFFFFFQVGINNSINPLTKQLSVIQLTF